MRNTLLLAIISIAALFIIHCASEEVKQPPQPTTVQEPAPSKKPTLKEVVKKRERDIK